MMQRPPQSMEDHMWQAVANAVSPIAHMEKEWDGSKLQSKLVEYLGKAAKSVGSGLGRTWQTVVHNFAEKFFEAFWRACGDRNWIELVDWTPMVAMGIQYNVSPQLLAGVDSATFMPVVTKAVQDGYDSSRYYSWGCQVVKQTINGKTSQKKVRDAVDTARDEVCKDPPPTGEAFIEQWIQRTHDVLHRSGSADALDRGSAIRLFTALVSEGGGLPKPMTDEMGGIPKGGWGPIDVACMKIFPEGAGGPTSTGSSWSAPTTAGGWGGDSSGWSGCGGWGGAASQQMMQAMLGGAMGGAMGGMSKGGGGKGGWGPY